MKLPWTKKREQRVTEIRAVRQQKRVHLDNEFGDIDFNRKRAAELAEQAKKRSG